MYKTNLFCHLGHHLRSVLSARHGIATAGCSGKAHQSQFIVHDSVRNALARNEAVVALESTILTHGMPFPDNLRMARSVESIIKKAGAQPATIALISGHVHIGLTVSQLEQVAHSSTSSTRVKVSRRDIAYTLNQGVLGGTTISGTMLLAHLAGIKVFVSGGLGGVHRGGESSLDISADLTELGRTPVALVTSGVKSILDIGRTLEYLETQGVCVATYGPTRQFPAFFTRDSGYKSACNVKNIEEAAQLVHTTMSLGLNSGLLIANPIGSEHEMEGKHIEESIQQAVKEAQDAEIKGREITPYILERVNQLTQGKSLKANISLVESNALIGAQMAVRLAELENENRGMGDGGSGKRVADTHYSIPSNKGDTSLTTPSNQQVADLSSRPAVIGASNLDCILHLQVQSVQFSGQTNNAISRLTCGGVGRNLCDGLTKLGHNPLFLTALGLDVNGEKVVGMSHHMDWSMALRVDRESTAYYSAVLDKAGDVFLGIGDMKIHDLITPQYILDNVDKVKQAPLIIMDGNISVDAMRTIGEISKQYNIPVFYEPTDVDKACKPFLADIQDRITFIKPNINEFKQIYRQATGEDVGNLDQASEALYAHLAHLCSHLTIPVILITLGAEGVLCYVRRMPHLALPRRIPKIPGSLHTVTNTEEEICIHIAAQPVDHITNVSGAGDCMAAGFISSYLKGEDILNCVLLGTEAARLSLLSYDTVPDSIKNLSLGNINSINRLTDR